MAVSRSLKLSSVGKNQVEHALTNKKWSTEDLADAAELARPTATNFRAGKAVDRKNFVKFCEVLELDWEIASGQTIAPSTLTIASPATSSQPDDSLFLQVREHCCEKIQGLYNKIRLLNFQQVDVDKLYVEVHILERPASKVYARIPDLLRGRDLRGDFDRFGLGGHNKRRLLGLDVANNFSKLMVLGKPGAGKSTFLRYLAIACCKGEFLPNHIPVLIELRSIRDISQFDLLNIIQRELRFTNQEQTQDILSIGKVLLLLDGLDEVADQARYIVQEQISSFIQTYYKSNIILTCRTQTVEYLLPNFECVEVADFNLEQVELFAHNWFTTLADTLEQGSTLATQFILTLSLPQHERTAELAVTPVLLSLTCWIFQDAGNLPTKRSELYQRGLDLLLERWDTERGITRTVGGQQYRSLDIWQKQALLSYVAIRKFEQEQFVLFEQLEIQHYITNYFKTFNQEISAQDSRDILQAIEAQHGLLVERASEIYSFSHLTFQEYFSAKFLCHLNDWQKSLSHVFEKHWREVFLLVVEMCDDADYVLQLMKQKIDTLIATDAKLQEFLTWLGRKACSIETEFEPVAIRAFYLSLELYFYYDNIDYAYDLPARMLDPNLPKWLNFELEQGLIAPLFNALTLDLALDVVLTRPGYLFDFALDRILSPELRHALQRLYIPDYQSVDIEGSEEWWERVGKWEPVSTSHDVSENQLKAVLSEHRDFGHDWQFTEQQENLLKQYYDANKLLVELMQIEGAASDSVRAEIENSLLLPWEGLQRRQS